MAELNFGSALLAVVYEVPVGSCTSVTAGIGGRGGSDLATMNHKPDVQFVAIADVEGREERFAVTFGLFVVSSFCRSTPLLSY